MAEVIARKPEISGPVPAKKHSWKKIVGLVLAGIIILAGLIYAGICIYGANTFNRHAGRVSSFGDNTPAKYGLNYQEVSFLSASNDGTTLRGWWIPRAGANRALVLVHGRDADRTKLLPMSRSLWEKDYNLLFFDLRGQGLSDGERYYFGQYEKWDVIGAFKFVQSRGFSADNIGVIGWSMGGASTLLALKETPDIKVVVTDASWADFGKLAEQRFSRDTGLPGFFLPGIFTASRILHGFDVNQARPVEALPAVSGRHIFLIHGDKDTDVSVQDVYQLQKAGGQNIYDTWVIPGAVHMECYSTVPEEYISRVTAFFDRFLKNTR